MGPGKCDFFPEVKRRKGLESPCAGCQLLCPVPSARCPVPSASSTSSRERWATLVLLHLGQKRNGSGRPVAWVGLRPCPHPEQTDASDPPLTLQPYQWSLLFFLGAGVLATPCSACPSLHMLHHAGAVSWGVLGQGGYFNAK